MIGKNFAPPPNVWYSLDSSRDDGEKPLAQYTDGDIEQLSAFAVLYTSEPGFRHIAQKRLQGIVAAAAKAAPLRGKDKIVWDALLISKYGRKEEADFVVGLGTGRHTPAKRLTPRVYTPGVPMSQAFPDNSLQHLHTVSSAGEFAGQRGNRDYQEFPENVHYRHNNHGHRQRLGDSAPRLSAAPSSSHPRIGVTDVADVAAASAEAVVTGDTALPPTEIVPLVHPEDDVEDSVFPDYDPEKLSPQFEAILDMCLEGKKISGDPQTSELGQ